nr:hypothetical protein Iba_chr12fCG8780 [Ipomoea batatas]
MHGKSVDHVLDSERVVAPPGAGLSENVEDQAFVTPAEVVPRVDSPSACVAPLKAVILTSLVFTRFTSPWLAHNISKEGTHYAEEVLVI